MMKVPPKYCYRWSKHNQYKSSEVMTQWPGFSQFSVYISTFISQPSISSLMIFDMQTLFFIYASHAKFQPIVSTGWLYRGVNMPKIGEKPDHLLITSDTVLQPCFASWKKFL